MNMIHFSSVTNLLDQRLTQAAMRKLVQFTFRRIGEPDFLIREKKQAEHRHVTANLFSYRGLCDPGDLKHQCRN